MTTKTEKTVAVSTASKKGTARVSEAGLKGLNPSADALDSTLFGNFENAHKMADSYIALNPDRRLA